ncbi:hypothetical protein [Paenibacillus larvae]|uniref:hypothetical protein n=1 Tax=Paenibacillus larvae TaxID=1464 RepID=UPI0037CB8044
MVCGGRPYEDLKRVTMQAMLVFSAMNLKRMATWLWKRSRPSDKFNFVFEIGITNIKNSRYCSISRTLSSIGRFL